MEGGAGQGGLSVLTVGLRVWGVPGEALQWGRRRPGLGVGGAGGIYATYVFKKPPCLPSGGRVGQVCEPKGQPGASVPAPGKDR